MTKDEALNIALQALETLMIERGSIYDKAITAIKEALADPSPNFNCKSVQARLATAWGYVKAQPEQEPVAWYRDEDGIRIYYETKCWDDATPLYTAPQPWEKFCDSNCVWTDHHPDCKLVEQEQEPVAFEEWLSNQHGDPEEIGFLQALRIAYISGQDSITTPPQRKPLSDEEIRLQWSEFWETECHPWAIQFARAIEAAVWEKQK